MCDPNPLLSAVQKGNGQDPADKSQSQEAQGVSYGTRNADVVRASDDPNAHLNPAGEVYVSRDSVVPESLLMVAKISALAAILHAHADDPQVAEFATTTQEEADTLCLTLLRQHMYDRNFV